MQKMFKPLLFLGAFAAMGLASVVPAHADTVGPAFVAAIPSPGESVRSLKYSESGNYVTGALTDNDGINRVSTVIRRYSDGAYWNGGNWQYPGVSVATTFTANNSAATSGYYQAFNGPPAAAIIAGQQYLVVVSAVDNLGNVSTYNATINGID